jgi:mRNA interferase HicA
MTGKQMLKLYKQNNWQVVSVKGSHYKLKKNEKIVIIPHHTTELKKGLQEYLLKRLEEVE